MMMRASRYEDLHRRHCVYKLDSYEESDSPFSLMFSECLARTANAHIKASRLLTTMYMM